MLVDVCCLLFVVCCEFVYSFDVVLVLFATCCGSFVVYFGFARCLLLACCLLCVGVIRCSLFVVRCLLFVVCSSLSLLAWCFLFDDVRC